MARRQSELESLLDGLKQLFREVPWWTGPPVIALIWLAFYVLVPGASKLVPDAGLVTSDNLSRLSRNLAPIFALAAGAVWIVALYQKLIDRNRLDNQSDPESIRTMSWLDFEALLAEAFRRHGYAVRATPSGADGGIDYILSKDGAETIVQAKHWKARSVGVKVVRELHGVRAARNANEAIVVSSGSFTRDARRFAVDSGVRLINGPALQAMLTPLRRESAPARTQTEPISPAIADRAPTLVPTRADKVPLCPRCNAPMVQRTARRGPSAGSSFWGCPAYPQCCATRPID